jgi:uncharacterized integral membrane protein
MSEQTPNPGPGTPSEPGSTPDESSSGSSSGSSSDDAQRAPAVTRSQARDPLRGSRASGAWVFVVVLVVLLTLLAIFVLQNTQSVEISFLGWTGSAPLAAALLIATAAGLLIAVTAGSLRILQLRHRVRREKKRGVRA